VAQLPILSVVAVFLELDLTPIIFVIVLQDTSRMAVFVMRVHTNVPTVLTLMSVQLALMLVLVVSLTAVTA